MKYKLININSIDDKSINKFYSNLDKNYKKHIDKILSKRKRKASITGLILLSKLLKEINIPFKNIKTTRNDRAIR